MDKDAAAGRGATSRISLEDFTEAVFSAVLRADAAHAKAQGNRDDPSGGGIGQKPTLPYKLPPIWFGIWYNPPWLDKEMGPGQFDQPGSIAQAGFSGASMDIGESINAGAQSKSR